MKLTGKHQQKWRQIPGSSRLGQGLGHTSDPTNEDDRLSAIQRAQRQHNQNIRQG